MWLLWLLFACRSQPGPDARDVRARTLVVASSELATLVPLVAVSNWDKTVLEPLHRPLVELDWDCGPVPRPGLATTWSWSEDGRVLSMTLRADARFTDGSPVTARDVAFTWDRVADPQTASRYLRAAAQLLPEGRPEVVDDHHLRWHFRGPGLPVERLIDVGTVPILSRALEAVDPASLRGVVDPPAGAGPYQLTERARGRHLLFEPNPHWTGPAPAIQRILWQIVPDPQTRLLELERGAVDLVAGVPSGDIQRLDDLPDLRIVERGPAFVHVVAWNNARVPLDDRRVRQALGHALDVDAILRQDYTTGERVFATRATSLTSPAHCGAAGARDAWPHDPDRARALLAEAGWVDRDGDGVRERGGEPLVLTLSASVDRGDRHAVAVRAQAAWAAVGVTLHIEELASHRLFSRVLSRDYQAALIGWQGTTRPDPFRLRGDVPEAPNRDNFAGYASAAVDRDIAAWQSATDPDERVRLLDRIHDTVLEDQPYLQLFWTHDTLAVSERIHDVQSTFPSRLYRMETWSFREAPGQDPPP